MFGFSTASVLNEPRSYLLDIPELGKPLYPNMNHARVSFMLRSNHLVQTVRTTFPVVQTVPFTFPLGISHLHLWRSGDGFSDSVCTAGKKMASLHRKPYIIALQLQLCTWRSPRTRRLPMRWQRRHCWCGGRGGLLVGKGAQEVWEKKRKKGKIIIIINKKLTGKINMKKRGKKIYI